MTKNDFVKMAYRALDERSCYVTGCFGWPLNYGDNLERIIDEWPNNQKPAHEEIIRQRAADAKAAGEECYGWDCINLVKGILMSWCADPSKEFGGAVFNGAIDKTVSDFFNTECYEQSTDFSHLEPGEMLYYGNGSHCGIYVGDGLAIEATGKWDRKVQQSAVENKEVLQNHPELYNYERKRTWQAHGKIRLVDYTEDTPMTYTIMCPCCGAKLNAQLTLAPEEDILAVHTVRDGESPWSIAVKYYGDGTKYYVIMDYNGLARNAYIYTGQQLKIPRI